MQYHSYTALTGGNWMRGNLHAHTLRSDGKRPAQEVVDDYAARGYGFLMLSDHDVFTSVDEFAPLQDNGLILVPGNEITADGPHIWNSES